MSAVAPSTGVALRGGVAPRLLAPEDIPGGPWLNAPAKRGGVVGAWLTPDLVCDRGGRVYRGAELDGWFVWLTDAEGHAMLSLRARLAAVLVDAFGAARVPSWMRAELGLPSGTTGDVALAHVDDGGVARLARFIARLWRLSEAKGLDLQPSTGNVLGAQLGGPLIPGVIEGGSPHGWFLQVRGHQVRLRDWSPGDTIEAVVDAELGIGGGR